MTKCMQNVKINYYIFQIITYFYNGYLQDGYTCISRIDHEVS